MYLIHGFFILYFALPLAHIANFISLNALTVSLLSLAFCWMIYLMARGMSFFYPIKKIRLQQLELELTAPQI